MIWIKSESLDLKHKAWAVVMFAGVTLFAWPLEMPLPDDAVIVKIEEQLW
jgi:hypothetical protein